MITVVHLFIAGKLLDHVTVSISRQTDREKEREREVLLL